MYLRNLIQIALIALLLCSPFAAKSQKWAPFQGKGTAVAPSGWGGGPNLRQQNVYGPNPITTSPYTYYVPGACGGPCSYADMIQVNGLTGFRPYDLHASSCASTAGNASAAEGRYIWFSFPDHESTSWSWNDGLDMMVGYSDDPGVLPKLVKPRLRYLSQVNSPGASFTGSVTGTNLLTVTGTVTGTIALTAPITWAGGSATISGANAGTGIGKAGTYTLSAASGNTGSVAMTSTFPNVQSNYFASFVCDPDDATWPYKVYIQVGNPSSPIGQYEMGVVVSADLVNWQLWGAITQPYIGSTSTNRAFSVYRSAPSTWVAIGVTALPQLSNNSGIAGVWTGTSGYLLEWTGMFGNPCLPTINNLNSLIQPCATGSTAFYLPAGGLPDGITTTVGGQAYMLTQMRLNTFGGTDTQGNQAALVPVDANYNVIASPAPIVLSDVYGPNGGASVFTGPQAQSDVTGYLEDGILHYYSRQGQFECLNAAGCLSSQKTYARAGPITTSSSTASGSTLHLNSVAGLFNGMLVYDNTNPNALAVVATYITGIGSPGANDITISPAVVSTVGSGDTLYFWNGGLAQELIDRYCYVTDASTAVNAAPTGVTATAAAGVVTLAWDQCLAGVNYRLYYGFSPTSQPNLVGAVTGSARTTTYTPYLQTPQTMYFKLVTMNGSTEEGSRVVPVYVSPSTALVNDHMRRVLALQADPATIDRAWLDSAASFMTTNNLTGTCRYWGDAGFGVKQDISGNVSVMFDLCSTLRPAGGDWGFCTGSNPCSGASTSVYLPTTFGNTTPGIQNTTTSYSYAGVTSGGRLNNLRRMTEITVCSSYSKPGSATATLFNFGSVNDYAPPAMYLQHTAAGNASFTIYDDATSATVTKAGSASGWHFICGTFSTAGSTSPTSKGTLEVYFDGVASGSPNTTALHTNVDPAGLLTLSLGTTLIGGVAGGENVFVGTGSESARYGFSGTGGANQPGPLTLPDRVYESAEGNFTEGATIIFDKAFTPTQIMDLYNIYNNRVNPPTAIGAVTAGGITAGNPAIYNITAMPSGASAVCNGSTDDAPAFVNFKALATAWDAANPSVPGAIVLNIPGAGANCLFTTQGGSFACGSVNHLVRVVGLGPTVSKLSDGVTGAGFFVGCSGMYDQAQLANQFSAIQTVSRGSSAVALTACPGAGCATAAALYTVGQPALITGLETQDSAPGAGYPTNPAFWDFVTITCSSTTTSCSGGNVSFTPPLTHDYKSTWPKYDATGWGGGPATMYRYQSEWASAIEYNNLEIDQNTQGIGAGAKSLTFKNVNFRTARAVDNDCPNPSQAQLIRFINSDMTKCNMEFDKLNDTVIFQNGPLHNIDFRSASAKQTLVSEMTITTNWNGGGIHTAIANSTIPNWAPGASSFGCSYGLLTMIGNNIGGITTQGASSSTPGVNGVGSWAGGVYTIANSDIPTIQGGNHSLGWAIPGCNIAFNATDPYQGPVLQVGDVTQSGSNTLVTFLQNGASYSGGLPTQPGATINAVAHYAPQLFAVGNYGNAWALDMNQVPPGAPMDSYSKIIVAGTNGTWTSATVPPTPPTVTGNPSTPFTDHAWGKFLGLNATVTAAYGGATSPFTFAMGGMFFDILGSTSRPQWFPAVDAKTASITPRFMGPTSTSGSTGMDALTSPSGGANTWFVFSQSQPGYSTASPSGGFGSTSTTVEIKVDQGVVNPAQQ